MEQYGAITVLVLAIVVWTAMLLGPVALGYVLRRTGRAHVVVIAVVAAASFAPIAGDSSGDDWRPDLFPFWAAASAGLAVAGVWLRRQRESRARDAAQ